MKPKGRPFEESLGKKRSAGFMFMGRVNGVNLYKHGIGYLNLDNAGQGHISSGKWRFEKPDFATELDKTENGSSRTRGDSGKCVRRVLYGPEAEGVTSGGHSARANRNSAGRYMHELEISGLLAESLTGRPRESAARDVKCAGGGKRDIRAVADASKRLAIMGAEKNPLPSLFAGSNSGGQSSASAVWSELPDSLTCGI